ncbi:hypothetical protein NP493_48g07027 [Ridgeia piscesae]|uniref:Uncharacterized protein n=1 Tax=Ridgeia piscesae TaxID=27915 RepID=A0AAD9PBC5_RIDPI|nr:hypothetical protein NP493_48g07027 [Ridgeia piscesae]
MSCALPAHRKADELEQRLNALKPVRKNVKCAALEPKNVTKNRDIKIFPVTSSTCIVWGHVSSRSLIIRSSRITKALSTPPPAEMKEATSTLHLFRLLHHP